MSSDEAAPFEYPDSAGYPDGTGLLDEGNAILVDEVTADALRQVDRPSADADAEIVVHRRDDAQAYVATIGELEVATLRYDEVDGRLRLLTTTVLPEFRGRGIATDLIADALDDIREHDRSITVLCPVVTAFIASNPPYADLVDAEHPGR